MRPPRRRRTRHEIVDLDDVDESLLDLVDRVLAKGVVLTGEIVLGVADVDLVYLRLSAVLCAADRVLPSGGFRPRRGIDKRA